MKDLDGYNPYTLKYLRLRGHFSTNAIEGSFGNMKKWTDHKIHPLQKILEMFVRQSRISMRNHLNIKFDQLDPNIYNGKKLGLYAINKIKRRYEKCLKIIANISHNDKNIANEAVQYITHCNCNKEDLPCVHIIYERILTFNKSEALIKEEDIPNIYFYNDLEKVSAKVNKVETISRNKEEKWDYNTTMDQMRFWADLAQRFEPARDLFREFYKKAENLKKTIDPLAKNTVVTAGAKPTVPSATVNRFSFPKKK